MSSKLRPLLLAAVALALAACHATEPARPALFEVDGPGGQQAWLFGTIHALPDGVKWHSQAIDGALARSDRLMLEAADLDDAKKAAAIFARLGTSPNLPPLRERVSPARRGAFDALLKRHGFSPDQLDGEETWAAALTLNQALQAESGSEGGKGIDLQLLAERGTKAVDQFEGVEPQLSMFDRLPETDQRALLEAVIDSAPDTAKAMALMQKAWKEGDMGAIAGLDHQDMLADPDLRDVLLVRRNRAWIALLKQRMATGARPFVAVGAMHLVGPDGLVAGLQGQGYRVTRLQ
ncbi:MAG: TraB/GumN family protein [Sphingomonadales bacterium]|nr:TraB/GumN family protein [Sphingomonadales bacterium]